MKLLNCEIYVILEFIIGKMSLYSLIKSLKIFGVLINEKVIKRKSWPETIKKIEPEFLIFPSVSSTSSQTSMEST